MLVAINKRYGGFHLSFEAIKWIMENGECPHIKLFDAKEFFGERNQDLHEMGLKQFKKDPNNTLFMFWGEKIITENHSSNARTCPQLIKVVQLLDIEANGRYAKIKLIDLPDGLNYDIDDYDGMETIHEVHRT